MLELGTDAAALDTTPSAAGICGPRQLICVQTFDIARLTSNPVRLIPGSFVAVSGNGPHGDSNESGKTSFLAATSLLLGDPEWNMTGGGPAATAALLFEPETAGVAAHNYPPSRQGYVIGVFADPDRAAETALTVWCKINATPEYFQVRYADGMHLVRGDSDLERHATADAGWAAMPTATQLGPRNYAERLYGDSPRCLAYVAERGKQKSRPSLLKMDAGAFTPEQIGEDLIRLTGRASAFEKEGQQRERLDDAQRKLTDRQDAHERITRDEDDQLTGVLARDRSRARLHDAEQVWRLHFAKGLLDALDKHAQASDHLDTANAHAAACLRDVQDAEQQLAGLEMPEDIARRQADAATAHETLQGRQAAARQRELEARNTVDQARRRVTELDRTADGYAGPPPPDAQAALTAAESARDNARERLGAARQRHQDAQQHVQAAEAGMEGRAGELAALLAERGIDAAPLMDIELTEPARAAWEPRLALYEHAVVVSANARPAALAVAETLPGSVLIAGQDTPALPAGVLSAPAGAGAFLARLEQLTPPAAAPERVEHIDLGVTVVGGFSEPQAGRASRLARAQTAFDAAEAAVAEAQQRVRSAEHAVDAAREQLARAEAADALPGARSELRTAEQTAATRAHEIAEFDAPLRAAATELREADAAVHSHEQALSAAEERLEARQTKHKTAAEQAREAQRALDSLQVDYWRANWADTPEAATAALIDETRSEKRLRNLAASLFQDALAALSIEHRRHGRADT